MKGMFPVFSVHVDITTVCIGNFIFVNCPSLGYIMAGLYD